MRFQLFGFLNFWLIPIPSCIIKILPSFNLIINITTYLDHTSMSNIDFHDFMSFESRWHGTSVHVSAQSIQLQEKKITCIIELIILNQSCFTWRWLRLCFVIKTVKSLINSATKWLSIATKGSSAIKKNFFFNLDVYSYIKNIHFN